MEFASLQLPSGLPAFEGKVLCSCDEFRVEGYYWGYGFDVFVGLRKKEKRYVSGCGVKSIVEILEMAFPFVETSLIEDKVKYVIKNIGDKYGVKCNGRYFVYYLGEGIEEKFLRQLFGDIFEVIMETLKELDKVNSVNRKRFLKKVSNRHLFSNFLFLI